MERALAYAVEHQFEWMWLGVWERNFKAQKFYEKQGFTRFSEHVFQMGDDPQTDWLLKRKVSMSLR
ncbi:MAG: GNAT family N-acetyltransferase [Cyclobacteriaceae bacterium]